jgi:HEAT repeat protein
VKGACGSKFAGWLGAVFFLLVFRTATAGEPGYNGKPASYWLDSWGTNMAAPDAFKAMGTNAVPFLIKVLETEPSSLGRFADKETAKYSTSHPKLSDAINKYLPSAYRAEDRCETAAFLLSELGTNAEAAIPALFRLYTSTNLNWKLASAVGGALASMGEKGVVLVPHYISWLTNSDPEIQQTGAAFLASVGPKARRAIPELVKASESTNHRLSVVAAGALWSIDRQTNIALRIYTQELQSTNMEHRRSALYSLRQMGLAAMDVGPLIQPFLRDSDDAIRNEAEKTLAEIAPSILQAGQRKMNQQSQEFLAMLLKQLREGEFADRFHALEAIAVFGPDAKTAVPALIDVLPGFIHPSGFLAPTSKQNTQREAANALAEIGPEARAAVPALIAQLRQRKEYHPPWICKALGCIGPDAKAAVPVLQEILQDKDNYNERLAAAVALTQIVPEQCSNAVTVLMALQHDPELAKLYHTDGRGGGTLQYHLDFQSSQSRFFRLSSSVALWKLGLEKESPASEIVEGLGKPDTGEQHWLLELAGAMGPEAHAAVPALEKLIGPDQLIRRRRAAAIAIRKIDPKEAERLNLPGILVQP